MFHQNTTPLPPAELPNGELFARVQADTLNHARTIGLSLLRTFADRPSYVLGITSALPHEGKSTIALGLAEVMSADLALKVMFLDTHAERPLNLTDQSDGPRLGISDWLAGECSLRDAAFNVHNRCVVLPFGTQPITSRDLLQYMIKQDALHQFREQCGLILLDLPDLTNPAGAALANLCDGVVIVVRAGDTPAEVVKEFLPVLQNVTIHGVVLNHYRPAVPAALRHLFA